MSEQWDIELLRCLLETLIVVTAASLSVLMDGDHATTLRDLTRE